MSKLYCLYSKQNEKYINLGQLFQCLFSFYYESYFRKLNYRINSYPNLLLSRNIMVNNKHVLNYSVWFIINGRLNICNAA